MDEANELMITGEKSIVGESRYEKLKERLQSFKIDNLTAREKALANAHEKHFLDAFIPLAWKIEGVSLAQLKQLDIEELKELSNWIEKETKISVILNKCSAVVSTSLCSCTVVLFPIVHEMWKNVSDGRRPFTKWQFVATKKSWKNFMEKTTFPATRFYATLDPAPKNSAKLFGQRGFIFN